MSGVQSLKYIESSAKNQDMTANLNITDMIPTLSRNGVGSKLTEGMPS